VIASDTRDKLLDIALELVQTRGFNAFSFRDIAERIGITTASIHYYFRTKADLGRELVIRHRGVLAEFLATVDATPNDAFERLRHYCRVFQTTLANGHRMCLGGMLAIEAATLPGEVVLEVRGFYDDNERWLTRTLEEGDRQGLLRFSPPPPSRILFDALEGAMLAARAFNDPTRLDAAIDWHLNQLRG
jgi:TetR/AcrR family transcriptional repressor of nem operon